MDLTLFRVDGFVSGGSGGNPAGVVLNADSLSTDDMQQIAACVGYSETAFVSSSSVCDYRVRFFTPTGEVAFCGHATVAVFSLLYKLKKLNAMTLSQETGAGNLAVRIEPDGRVFMAQAQVNFADVLTDEAVYQALGIELVERTEPRLPCQIVSTGLRDILVPVPSLKDLQSLSPNMSVLSEFSARCDVVGLHVFFIESNGEGIHKVHCRNFAPLVGIAEESATGSSCGALACYLHFYLSEHPEQFHFIQGESMNCLSEIFAGVDSSTGQVEVSGYGHLVDTLTLHKADSLWSLLALSVETDGG